MSSAPTKEGNVTDTENWPKWYTKWIIIELRIWNYLKYYNPTAMKAILAVVWRNMEKQDFRTRNLVMQVRSSNQLTYEAADGRKLIIYGPKSSRDEWINEEMIYEKNHSSNRLIRNTEELHLWPQSIRRDFPYFSFRFSLIIWAEFIKLQVYCKVARD